MNLLLHHLRFAVRSLLRAPGFTLVALLTLALGIGANTAIWSVVEAALLRQPPFPEAERLVQLQRGYRSGRSPAVAIPKFLYWRDHNRVFAAVAAYDIVGSGFNLKGDGLPEHLTGSRVSRDFFTVFGTPPAIGRDFLPEEDRPGAPRVVILSHGLWQRRFGADRTIVGRAIVLNDEPYTVVGIMPAAFHYPSTSQLWTPLDIDPANAEKANYLVVTARLRPGVGLARAHSDMAVVAQGFRTLHPEDMNEDESISAITLREYLYGKMRPALLILQGAVIAVLLIACVNVANLQLARAAARRRELAVRSALGAGGRRLFAQLLTESLVLSLAGGTLGLLLGTWVQRPLLALSPTDAMGPAGLDLQAVGLDPGVLAFTFGLSLLAGVLFGFAPAFQAARTHLAAPLAESSGRTAGGRRGTLARRALVTSEVALALILVTGAALLVKSFAGLSATDPGFRSRGALSVRLSLPARYQDPGTLERFGREVRERVGGLPGVERVALASSLPLELGPDMPFVIQGKWPGGDSQEGVGSAQYRAVTAGYVEALGIRLARGRAFAESDVAHSEPVALINEAAARRFWPGAEPLGQQIQVGLPFVPELADAAPRRIVGVVADVRERGLAEEAPPIVYVPLGQMPAPFAVLLLRALPLSLVVRSAGAPAGLAQAVGREILRVDPAQPVSGTATLDQLVERSLGSDRFNLILLGSLALLALLLAAVGIYGVLAYLVSQRTREIGVRMALGATGRQVLRMVVGQGLVPVAAGVVLGLAGAFALTRLLASLLVGVSATDPAVFLLTPVLLSAVALVASVLPARRASRLDPLTALRRD